MRIKINLRKLTIHKLYNLGRRSCFLSNIISRMLLITLFLIAINLYAATDSKSNSNISFSNIPALSNDEEIKILKDQIKILSEQLTSLNAKLEELEKKQQKQEKINKDIQNSTIAYSRISMQNQNPDISVVGVANIKSSTDKRDKDRNSVKLEGSEIYLSKNVSPYTRAALMLGYHGDEGHVEEGYAEFSHVLPGKLEAKIGKFLVPVGVLNSIHSHDWPIAAKPLPLKFYYGDEHGWNEDGLSLNTPLIMNDKIYLHFDAHLLNGDSKILFNNGQTKVYGGKIWGNLAFDDKSDLNFSLSYHDGAWNNIGDLYSKLYTVSAMYRYRFNQFDRFTLWAEWLQNKREQLNLPSFDSFGYYICAMYKFKKANNWHIGLEYDCTEKPTDKRFNVIAKSIFAGFWFTENDRLQLQYRKVRDPFIGSSYNELFLQFIWGFGPHKPHLVNF